MLVDVEFLCFDARPMLAHKIFKEKVVGHLKPLHRHNGAIMSTTGEKSNPTYYRNIGALSTKRPPNKEVKPAIFKTCNSIKFLSFQEHEMDFGAEHHYLSRKNKVVIRQFSTSNYGIVNHLKLGFGFNIKPKKKGDERTMDEDAFSDLMDFIFQIKATTKHCELPLWRLGEIEKIEKTGELKDGWMPHIVSCSTKHGRHFHHEKDPNVVSCEATAVIIYAKGELPDYPGSNTFSIKNCGHNIKISWHDFEEYSMRAYFIEHDKDPDKELKEFLKNLKLNLFKLRSGYACVEQAFGIRRKTGNVHKQFVKNIDAGIRKITDNEEYEFLGVGNSGDDDKIVDQLCHKDICSKIDAMLKDNRVL